MSDENFGDPKAGSTPLDPKSINAAQRRATTEGVSGPVQTRAMHTRTVASEAQDTSLAGAFRRRSTDPQPEEPAPMRPVEQAAAAVRSTTAPATQPAYRGAHSNQQQQLPPADMDDGPMTPHQLGGFPTVRLRRNRKSDWSRRMVRENRLNVDDLIWPIFLQEDNGTTPIEPMPGVVRYGPDELLPAVNEAVELGIPMIALFPEVPEAKKTEDCREAVNPENLVCQATRAVKEAFDGLGVMNDVALDPYNALGHDGLVDTSINPDGIILNDETLEVLIDQALVQAEAGCDVIAPSDMMDGRIGVIRTALDEAGYEDVQILSYAAKYASAFYGPFRAAIGSQGALKGDKRSYQMDPANRLEAIREVKLDIDEGADMIMVKPGMPYLDIIREIKDQFAMPTFAYQVSGEYAMLAAAAENGWLNGNDVMLESLMAFKRAGADGIMTYAALDVAREMGR